MQGTVIFGLSLMFSVTCVAQDKVVFEDPSEAIFTQLAADPQAGASNAQSTKPTPPNNQQQEPPASPPNAPSATKKAVPPKHESVQLVMLSSDNWTPIDKKQKFGLWWKDLISPGTHLSIAGAAWLSWTTNDQTYMGPGFKGWAKRYGYGVADEANGQFFSAFLLPVMFKQDPRYLPMDHGSKKRRTAYAISRVLITRTDSGGEAFNISKVGGTFISSSLSNAYYPDGRDNSAGAAFSRAGFSLLTDGGYNIFVEFWPDFARKIHLGKFFQQLVRRSVRVPRTTF
jgi:hypothetical protein